MIDSLKKKIKNKTNAQNLSFWFVRHGESEGNALGDTCPVMHDTPLTERGRQEAKEIISYLRKENIKVTHIYTAPKGRSYQTAEIIASALGLPVNIKNGLDERNWGIWKNLRWEEASARLDEMPLKDRYAFIPEGGESWQQMEQRLFAVLEEIADESIAGENILIITHRGCLRAVMPKLAKEGLEKHKEFSVATGALSKFSFEKDKFDFVGFIPKALAVVFAFFSNILR
ncbi:MAG: Fructose-2,6-bisphosphatase [Candidatus Nomurabacteria bacterium GW2011_GWF2_43_8]|uniref:phosphoglycerate mutase (2,3-diphosphoglycerate-dependent) n=3 Tax=Candidatus Nomuraibacteriota TaxID=1752729 RepID=A0A0G1HYF9_9BACT|nr:MAG: Fructose-2,6-bisphosphatase [Candidatus Nomurabacteria bacterium GW2011_GWA2_43_15]KKT19101.1 MAG: Fructose-2,6-bisphosphatase [Candidatus Nomurabacteria bacterium GW2011_GWB1_43_7]KKT24657.1 MAG: Fructose-2,6-bisphosphatase [Candidatus Nomurabacteria bacterium GW2011_GWF2_43_8]